MSALVQAVEQSCAYVNNHLNLLGGSLTLEERTECDEHAKESMTMALHGVAAISEADATTMTSHLANSQLIQETKLHLARLVRSKVSAIRVNHTPNLRSPPQSNLWYHRYLGQHHWATLVDPEVPWPVKLRVIVEVSSDMGLTHPTEITLTHIVSVVELAVNQHSTLDLCVGDAWTKRGQIKDGITALRRFPLPQFGQVRDYPDSPNDLPSLVYNVLYKVGTSKEYRPVDCPLDESILNVLRARMPTRKTHSSVAAVIKMHTPSKMQALMRGITTAMNMGMAPEMDPQLPAFKQCQPRRTYSDGGLELFPSKALTDFKGPDSGQSLKTGLGSGEQPITSEKALTNDPSGQVVPSEVGPTTAGSTRPGEDIAGMAAHVMSVLSGAPAAPKPSPKKGPAAKKSPTKGPAAKGTIKKKPSGNASSITKLVYPGKPNCKTEPMYYKQYRILTDIPSLCWRVKIDGDRTLMCASFKKDPKKGWEKVSKFVGAE